MALVPTGRRAWTAYCRDTLCRRERRAALGASSSPAGRSQSADMLWNQRRWVFPGDQSTEPGCVLLAARKRAPEAACGDPERGPLNDADAFRVRASCASPTSSPICEAGRRPLELPSLPDPRAAAVFERCSIIRGSTARIARGGRCRTASFTPRPTGTSTTRTARLAGMEGRTFDRYHPICTARSIGRAGTDLERLQRKRLGSHGVFGDVPGDVLDDPGNAAAARLPDRVPRCRACDGPPDDDGCLAPPEVFVIHIAPQLVWPRGTRRHALRPRGSQQPSLRLARATARRDTHDLRHPQRTARSGRRRAHSRIADLAGRLSCRDERYADFAGLLEVECGPLDESRRARWRPRSTLSSPAPTAWPPTTCA